MLQLPQKTSSSRNVRPQTLQFRASESTIGLGSDSRFEEDERAESCSGLLWPFFLTISDWIGTFSGGNFFACTLSLCCCNTYAAASNCSNPASSRRSLLLAPVEEDDVKGLVLCSRYCKTLWPDISRKSLTTQAGRAGKRITYAKAAEPRHPRNTPFGALLQVNILCYQYVRCIPPTRLE